MDEELVQNDVMDEEDVHNRRLKYSDASIYVGR